ncbi:MAG TPA: YbhB/YbcL family Raf kinase inhibitor-like protein [Actinomycetes bacterium]|nr:YbhB/YbcL family Raf kinase inhibitor-like protein [Actinomycetes bacterium]
MHRERVPDPYDLLPEVPSFSLTSEDVADGEKLDITHVHDSADGENDSPQLSWSDFPEETRSFVVSCLDPDAPTGSGWWHWMAVALPVSTTSLPRGAGASDEDLPGKAFHARNDYGTRDFGGAAPPPGDPPHRYIFAVHAVDVESLGLTPDVTPAVVAGTLQSHTLARATLRPIYGR